MFKKRPVIQLLQDGEAETGDDGELPGDPEAKMFFLTNFGC